jgi:hypothetical protein
MEELRQKGNDREPKIDVSQEGKNIIFRRVGMNI